MRWKKLRQSKNVEHRRGSSAGRGLALKGGFGTLIMAIIAIFIFKQDPQQVISGVVQDSGSSQNRAATPQDKETEAFIRAIKGSTEDVWTRLFQKAGKRYRIPRMIDYDGRTSMKTGGVADARMGPFYVPSEEQIYLDIAFFNQMRTNLGGGGDFAYAYVIAHEVGHHVQNLIGNTDRVHKRRGRVSEREYNQLSVRLELQADFLAGVWAHHANEEYRAQHGVNLLEEGDIQEAMNAAKAIGDDALQRKAGGRVIKDSFTHGTSEQRLRWFIKGIRKGDLSEMDTFSMPYHML